MADLRGEPPGSRLSPHPVLQPPLQRQPVAMGQPPGILVTTVPGCILLGTVPATVDDCRIKARRLSKRVVSITRGRIASLSIQRPQPPRAQPYLGEPVGPAAPLWRVQPRRLLGSRRFMATAQTGK